MSQRIPLGPFELHEPIGKGGMGTVWSGVHVPQQVPVAIKVLNAEGTRRDEYIEAFHNEVRAVAALKHPAIIMPLDYGAIPEGTERASKGVLAAGSPYIIMELAKRGSLKRFQDVLGWTELKLVLFTLLDALAHAHGMGVIHRDLKPANVLVGCVGPEPGIKLTDFGLARAADSFERAGLTEVGWGTPLYMAPEQFRGSWRDYGPWTDLYGLGVMAYQLACGALPFSSTSSMGYARAHSLMPPPKLEPRMPVPDGFDAWVMRMLQKSPSDRYQRAADASWGLHLLGDPTELVGRQTVSLFPSHHETDDLTMSHQKVGATAKQAVKVYDPDPTLMDRPDTTQLLLDELKPAHITQSSLQWEPESEDGILAELGNLAERMVPPLPYHWRPTKKSMQSPKLLGAGLGLFGLRAIPVVGRDELKDKLWNTLKTVRQSGALQVVILQGPAGTGKTCLAHWMARRAHEVGSAEVFFAQHSPTGGSAMGLPRMIARQLRCVGLTHAETEDRLREVLKPLQMGDDLAAQGLTEVMLPSIKPEQSRAIQFSTAEQKFGLIHRYLQEASRDRPALVVLDDVQWGTEALALTLHLIEKDRARPLKGLLLLTVRDEALPNRPVEDAMLEALTSHQQSQLLEISPLNAEHTDQLVRELLYLNEHLSDQIEARSGGNPLFAVQLIGDLVDGDKLKFAADGFELRRGALLKIPDDIHSLWMSRLATRTGAQNLEVMKSLEAAAALGQTVDLEEWTTICGFMDLEVSPALVANLLASGLIVREEGGWSFCHQLLRESVERHARESFRWIPVNKSCLQMLLARHPQGEFPVSERLATHYLACGDRPAALTPLLVSARARIDSSDFEMALGHLREFDKTVDLLASAENRRVESWLLRGELQIQRGQYDEALRLAEISAIEGRKAGRTDLIALALRIEGTAQLQTGQLKQAERTLRRARDHYDELNDLTGLANATLALARVSEFEGDLDVALSLLKEVEVLFQQSSHTMGLARTYNAFGDVYRHLGDDENAKDYSHKAMKLFERLGNQIGVADCINDLSEIARNQNQLEAALNSCEQALAMYEALGADQSMFVRINLGRILQDMSRYAEARQVFQEIKVHFQTTKQWGLLTEVSIYSLLSLAALDEWDEWNVYLESAKDLVTRTGVWGPEFENLLTRVKHAIERKGRMLESDALDSLMARGQTVTS